MALVNLLYRCPLCGTDPARGAGDRAMCDACGAAFSRRRGERTIHVRSPSTGSRDIPVHALMAAIEAFGGPMTSARGDDGKVSYEATVQLRRSNRERPVRYRGEVLGFAEALEEPEPGLLRITKDRLALFGPGDEAIVDEWPLLSLWAVQTASSTLQISLADGSVFQFRFTDDSLYRWERLLHTLLREAYRREGKGEIVEFQPRIVTE